MTQTHTRATARPTPHTRVAVLAAGLLLAALDLAIKATAVVRLSEPVDLGVIELRVSYNPGVAFSLGNTLPPIVVLVGTAAITLALATYVVVAAPTLSRWALIGLVLVTGGALGNLVDRATDGVVTDYLHTGWFPTFNLADILITFGAAALLWGTIWESRHHESATDSGP